MPVQKALFLELRSVPFPSLHLALEAPLYLGEQQGYIFTKQKSFYLIHFREYTIRLAQDTHDRIICQKDVLSFDELKLKMDLIKVPTKNRACFKDYLYFSKQIILPSFYHK